MRELLLMMGFQGLDAQMGYQDNGKFRSTMYGKTTGQASHYVISIFVLI